MLTFRADWWEPRSNPLPLPVWQRIDGRYAHAKGLQMELWDIFLCRCLHLWILPHWSLLSGWSLEGTSLLSYRPTRPKPTPPPHIHSLSPTLPCFLSFCGQAQRNRSPWATGYHRDGFQHTFLPISVLVQVGRKTSCQNFLGHRY